MDGWILLRRLVLLEHLAMLKKANKLLKGIPLDCSVNSENVGV